MNYLKIYELIREKLFQFATIISPELNTRLRYKSVFDKKINLRNPQTFNEKLLWLKLYNYASNPLVIKCVDKYEVRDYIQSCGYGELLNELLGVYDSPSEIVWKDLPNQFVLKWNFGAGMNIICRDKDAISETMVKKQLNKWRKNKYWLSNSEMQYKKYPKKIICEKYLESKQECDLPDYKVYCFHGVPRAILVMHDRGGDMRTEFFDTEWRPLENSHKYKNTLQPTAKPECLELMLMASKSFSKPFPFVRCDFYIVDGKLYFGELTFTPAGGLYTSETLIEGKQMTDYLDVGLKVD